VTLATALPAGSPVSDIERADVVCSLAFLKTL